MDPVGVISLVLDASKDLYTYYRAVRDCNPDIKELRTQLLSLQHTALSLTTVLSRDGLSGEDKSQVDFASAKCEDAAAELKSALDRIKLEGVQPYTALEKVKAAGRKAVYPFKKSTIAGLLEDTESCQDALQTAISILQLNISATNAEQLEKLDDRLVAGTTKLETALISLATANDTAKDEIVHHLLRTRKMLENDGKRRKAMAIVKSLKYPQMTHREGQISATDDTSLDWLFHGEEFKHHTQLVNLIAFLETGSGLFWIRGKPASGKSTLMKYLLNRGHGQEKLWSCSCSRDVNSISHFCWIAGTAMECSQQGLLQSLLYQVLLTDLALVPSPVLFSGSLTPILCQNLPSNGTLDLVS